MLAVNNGHAVPESSRLANSERELSDAFVEQYEAFYRQGEILERIKDDQEFRDANYSSFDEYMDSRRPLGIGRAYAWRLIAAKNVRALLPTPDSPIGESGGWSESTIRPLTHKAFKPRDQKRIGAKVVAKVHKGEKLTADLVKQICDDERGVERKKQKKKAEAIRNTETASEVLRRCSREVELWQSALEKFSGQAWKDVEMDDPGCTKELVRSLSGFASFLSSKPEG